MAYTADINIVVRGQAAVNTLQKSLNDLGTRLDDLAKKRLGPVSNLDTFNKQLSEASTRLNQVVAGTKNETEAIKNYVTALGNANAASARQNKLIQEEIDLRQAATVGARELNAVLAGLAEKQRQLENSKLDEKAELVQKALDAQAAAAAESAVQIDKLNQRQQEFTARTDAAAQAASRQTAEFIRQQRIAKEVAKINANAPAPQLLLPAAAPGSPAFSGGARRRITGPVERLGGARTQDEAAAALRLAAATDVLAESTNKVDAAFNRFLPDTAELNAAGRGIERLTTNQEEFNQSIQRGIRFNKKLNDELARQRSLGIGVPSNIQPGTSNVFKGPFPVSGLAPLSLYGQGKARKPPAGTGQGVSAGSAISNAIIGGAFPLLFGQSAGAAVGGAIGGAAGELALGPAGGFAGSLLGTALGSITDSEQQVKKLAATLGLASIEADRFAESFKKAGVDVDQFTQAVNEIQGLNIPFQQQADAISIATALSANYKGSLTGVAATLADLGSTGVISVNTLKTLTAANVPVVESLAKTFGVTKDKVLELAAEGSISVSQLLQELTKLGNQDKPQTAIERLGEAFSKLTNSVLSVLGPPLEAVGDTLVGVIDKISAGFGFVADVLFPKFTQAIAPIAEAITGAFPADVFDAVASAFQGLIVTALERATVVIGKLAPIIAAVIGKFKELSNNPVFKFIAEQVGRLTNFLGLSNTEVDKYAAKQKNAANETKNTEEAAKKLAAQLAAAAQAQLQLDQQNLSTRQALVAVDQSRIQNQLQLTTSLNQESSLIDALAQKRQEANALEIEAAQLAARASIEKAQREGANVGLAKKLAASNLQAADARFRDVAASIELAAKQQQVAAFAADAANQTERFNRASNESLNALNNNVRALDAFTQAQTTINNLEIQSLENKLAQVSGDAERSAILGQIRDLEIDNAKLVLQATRTQIAAEVERQRIALAQAEVKFRELEAVVRLAAAQGVLNRQYLEALDAQRSAVVIAQQNLETSIRVAAEQDRAALAVFNAAVNAANLRANLEGSAAAANSLASAAERFSSASQTGNTVVFGAAGRNRFFNQLFTEAVKELNLESLAPETAQRRFQELQFKFLEIAERFNQSLATEELNRAEEEFRNATTTTVTLRNGLEELNNSASNAAAALNNIAVGPNANPEAAFAAGGYVTRPTRALVAEAGEPEYIIPRSKMTEAMQRYAAGARGEAVIPGGGSTLQPQVNITTGPVMQMNGTSYVTQADLMTATSTAAKQGASMALQMLQNSPKARRSAGVTR